MQDAKYLLSPKNQGDSHPARATRFIDRIQRRQIQCRPGPSQRLGTASIRACRQCVFFVKTWAAFQAGVGAIALSGPLKPQIKRHYIASLKYWFNTIFNKTLFKIKTAIAGCFPDVKDIIEIVGKGAIEKLIVGQTINQQSVPTWQAQPLPRLLQNRRVEKEYRLSKF